MFAGLISQLPEMHFAKLDILNRIDRRWFDLYLITTDPSILENSDIMMQNINSGGHEVTF